MRFLLVAVSWFAFVGCSPTTANKSEDTHAYDEAEPPWKKVFASSQDRDELTKTAIALCEARDEAGINVLVKLLQDPSFLDRLDTNEDYAHGYDQLRVNQIMDVIAKLPHQRAEGALLKLGKSEQFTSSYHRVKGLVSAAAALHAPSVELLDLLDSLADSEKTTRFIVVECFGRMHSAAACKRIETWFHSPEHVRRKRLLFTTVLVFERHNPEIVALYGRLIRSQIADKNLRDIVVQTLFDFRPLAWHKPLDCPNEVPKSWSEVATPVLEELLRISDECFKLDISEVTKQGIVNAKKEIDRLLVFRQSGGPERIEKLIAELDDSSFKVRENASKQLEEYGDLAEPSLRAALKKNLPLEVKQRITKILAKIKK